MLRSIMVTVLIAVGATMVPAQTNGKSPQDWERILRALPDSGTAEIVAVLWEYTISLVNIATVGIKRADIAQRGALEWLMEDWLSGRVDAIKITNGTAQALAGIVSEYISQEVDEALATAPPVPRPATAPPMAQEEAAANRRRLTGN